jgi:hypothetical protein
MTNRRTLLISAAASLLCAPAIVRSGSLMPVRRVVLRLNHSYYGFTDRLSVYGYLPRINNRLNAGLSPREIAVELGSDWDARRVLGVIRRDEEIRRSDAILRAERVFTLAPTVG